MVKADGSVLVHSDGGSYKPLNWMSPPCKLTEEPGRWVVTGKTGEKVEIPTKVVTSETLKTFVQPDLPDNVWLLGTQLPPEELKKQATR